MYVHFSINIYFYYLIVIASYLYPSMMHMTFYLSVCSYPPSPRRYPHATPLRAMAFLLIGTSNHPLISPQPSPSTLPASSPLLPLTHPPVIISLLMTSLRARTFLKSSITDPVPSLTPPPLPPSSSLHPLLHVPIVHLLCDIPVIHPLCHPNPNPNPNLSPQR